jgi:hypothetical protein
VPVGDSPHCQLHRHQGKYRLAHHPDSQGDTGHTHESPTTTITIAITIIITMMMMIMMMMVMTTMITAMMYFVLPCHSLSLACYLRKRKTVSKFMH